MNVVVLQSLSSPEISLVELFFALAPVLCLIILMGVLKMSGHISALLTLIVTLISSLFYFNFPIADTGVTLLYGVSKAFVPILVIIITAIFSYNVLVMTKKMEVIKSQFSSISSEKCIQVLLLTWGFGGLLEGMAGFGTAVAIPAAILISLGFKPIFSAVASLIANSVCTAFGAIGVPVIVLAKQAGLDDVALLSSNVVLQLSPLMFIVPFILVFITEPKWKAVPKHLLLSAIVGGVTLVTQYFSAIYIGAETPAILGSIASIIAIIIYAKLTASKEDKKREKPSFSLKESLSAWSVYGLILFLVILTSPLFSLKEALEGTGWITYMLQFNIFDSDLQTSVLREVKLSWLDASMLLLTGSVVGGLIQGAKLKDLAKLLWETFLKQKKTILTVCCLISLSSLMDFSGMIGVLGLALATATGAFYPLFAPTIGCLGTFLTGSDTSSNILFGKLQASVANQIGADPSWLSAANTAGATGGKIISPQSIAVATSACGQQGKEGEIMKKAIPFALAYILVCGLVVYFFR